MKTIFIAILMFVSVSNCFSQETVELKNWKCNTIDNFDCAKIGYDDSAWKPYKTEGNQDAKSDACTWYRIKFGLPFGWKSEDLKFSLGKITDCDQVFLNGKLLVYNGKYISSDFTEALPGTSELVKTKNSTRQYFVPENDSRLLFDKENLLAIRINNNGPNKGILPLPITVNLSDYLLIDTDSKGLEPATNGMLSKTIILKNISSQPQITGKLTMVVTDDESKKVVAQKVYEVHLKKEEQSFTIAFKSDWTKRLKARYTFTEPTTQTVIIHAQEFPYILTPKQPEMPRINGPKVFGVRPGSPFLFRIPASGLKPMTYAAEKLPEGLSLNAKTGVITGSVYKAGEYNVTLTAKNSKGSDSRNLKIVVGSQIVLTPPMGWNSWNCYHLGVNEEKVKVNADMIVKSGLADYGYSYINMDDGWEAPKRDPEGKIMPNEKFKDMKALTDYIHGYGLKAGLYSSPGATTCGGYLGSYGFEESDANTFAGWGFDYLKYDWCSYGDVAKDQSLPELQKPYKVMRAAFDKANRDIVYSLCQYGMGNVWEWGGSVGGNAWRITGDIEDFWERLYGIGFNKDAAAPYAKPGNWNDPDMLVVGWLGFGKMHPSHLTPSEQYTHISLWSLLAAPLIIGCDLTRLDDFTMNLLTNDEVIAIDQDPLGKQGTAVLKDANYQVIVKELEDGSKAVGLFNLTENDLKISTPWDALKLSGKQLVRDVWRQKDLGVFTDKFESLVPPHGVVLVKIRK
jgi:alpha-galactosidase